MSKLKDLSPVSLRNKVRNTFYDQILNRTENEKLYGILDKIDDAIERNKKIEITPCWYNEHKILEDGAINTISPYYIVTSDSRYYVIGYVEREGRPEGRLENRRIDRISKVDILDQSRDAPKRYKQGRCEYRLRKVHEGACILELLDNKPILVAFGGTTYDYLKKGFGDKYKIIKLVHYSYYGSKPYSSPDSYREYVLDTLKSEAII